MSQSTSTEIKQPRAEVDFWLFSEVVAGFIQVGLFGSIAAHCCLGRYRACSVDFVPV